jgi:hypothetical protein
MMINLRVGKAGHAARTKGKEINNLTLFKNLVNRDHWGAPEHFNITIITFVLSSSSSFGSSIII